MPESLNVNAGRDVVFDRITRLVRNIFGIDVAAVSLIEHGRQHFRSIDGLALTSIPLDESFCRATWREGQRVVIADTTQSLEFRDHPLVIEDPRYRAYAGFPLNTSDGEPIGTMCAIHRSPREFTDRDILILEDLAQLAATEFELHEWATLDTLTGALTRRVFHSQAIRLCELTADRKIPMSIILFDIDRFKCINDRFGHTAGDEVLAAIVAACRTGLRDHDLIGRLGGEEFAVAMEGSSAKAVGVAERLREAVQALCFTFAGETIHVTASFGVAQLEHGPKAVPEGITRADVALYQAKGDGRNRTVLAQPPGQGIPIP